MERMKKRKAESGKRERRGDPCGRPGARRTDCHDQRSRWSRNDIFYKECGGRRDTWVPPYKALFCRGGRPCPPGPITQRFVGQGPCALPGLRRLSGGGARSPRPYGGGCKGAFLRDGGIFSQIHKKFSSKLQMQLLRVGFLWYTTSTARKTGCGPNHNKEELYNEEMGMFCLRLCVRG